MKEVLKLIEAAVDILLLLGEREFDEAGDKYFDRTTCDWGMETEALGNAILAAKEAMERERNLMAQAWKEGFASGFDCSDSGRHSSEYPNPYALASTDPTGEKI